MLLVTVDRSIWEIAAAVGYSDLTTFERVFRKHVGLCPRAFRRLTVIGPSRCLEETQDAENRTRNAETATPSHE